MVFNSSRLRAALFRVVLVMAVIVVPPVAGPLTATAAPSAPTSPVVASSPSASPSPSPARRPEGGNEVACACGCSVFDVGNIHGMVPARPSGGMVWFRYSYMDQNVNFRGSSRAPASLNGDRRLATSFFTFGGQYTLDSNWTLMGELPIFDRSLTTTDDGSVTGPAGSTYTARTFALGDLKVMADYTGLSPDMTTGLTFGLKLPTGESTSASGPLGGSYFDHDSLPGTGSTDLMLGAYHIGDVADNMKIPYWVQASYSTAFATTHQYRPGNELDLALGIGYNFGPLVGTATLPSLQLLGSFRNPDGGANADPLNSGYSRLMLAPGVEFQFDRFRVYADVEYPIAQRVNAASNVNIVGTTGQLVAPVLYKVQVGYEF